MKPELTPELKERFFAHYWGQNAIVVHSNFYPKKSGDMIPINHSMMGSYLKNRKLKIALSLRPLSSITDEEAIEVAKICGYGKNKRTLDLIKSEVAKGFSVIEFDDENSLEIDLAAYDYLRSIGVALPFMGHSVEELVEAGWIKLVEK